MIATIQSASLQDAHKDGRSLINFLLEADGNYYNTFVVLNNRPAILSIYKWCAMPEISTEYDFHLFKNKIIPIELIPFDYMGRTTMVCFFNYRTLFDAR